MAESLSGKLIIISGPSGAGKTTVVRRLLKECPLPLELSVSATTRPPRDKEIDGQSYHFLTSDEFARRREAGDFLECFEVFGRGHWYGTLRAEVATSLARGKWVILEIDVQGAMKVIEQQPRAVTIFIRPDSMQVLEQRLRGRGTESEEKIQQRLATARHEWQFAGKYRYCVVNDTLDHTVDEICQLLQHHQDDGRPAPTAR